MSIIHMIFFITSLYLFHLSFLILFKPYGPINLPFAHFLCVPHFSSFPVALSSLSLPCCLFIHSFFSFSYPIFPSLTWTLIVNVSVRKRGKKCVRLVTEISFILLTAGVCLGLTRSYAISITHTHTPTELSHYCTLPLQPLCIALML